MVQMPESSVPPGIDAFVAIGDSFTEGLNDPAPGGGFRGWADLVAGALAAQRPGFRYANLAIRGKLLGQVVAEQASPTSMGATWSTCGPCGRSRTPAPGARTGCT